MIVTRGQAGKKSLDTCLPPIGRAGLSGELDVMGDMMRPREKRDAILGHVASWGDRKTPMALLQRSKAALSIEVVRFNYTCA